MLTEIVKEGLACDAVPFKRIRRVIEKPIIFRVTVRYDGVYFCHPHTEQ
jgi:hypothetical protein